MKGALLMYKRFFDGWDNLELRKKFINYIEKENTKRFVILLYMVALSQFLFFLLEAFGAFEWNIVVFYSRLVVFIISLLLALLMRHFVNKLKEENHFKILWAVKAFLHLFILAIGCYFTVFMFSGSVLTYSPFIITAVLISVTHIRWPLSSNIFLLGVFIALSTYISMAYTVPSYFIGESITASILVAIISVVNVLNYRRFWDSFVQEEKIKEMNEKLTDLSQKDTLTGIYNRRRVLEELEEFAGLSKRYKTRFCVAMIDLDYFKKVNDKYGHSVGDDVLCEFSEVLTNLLRDSDIFGRWGGEEFIVVIPNTDKDGAYTLIERARQEVQMHDFMTIGNITFSAGVCEFQDEYNVDNVVDNADFALYLSKRLGRNKVSVFSKELKKDSI